ncbi:MAG: class I SAM-dependent methyltransferase [Planctomycetota bacterium]
MTAPSPQDEGPRESVPCVVCGADEPSPFIDLQESIEGIGGSFTLQRCGRCGHLYLSPRPTPEDLGRFYPSRYYGPVASLPADATPDNETGNNPAAPALTTHIRHQGGRRVRRIQSALRQHLGYPGDEPVTAGRKLLTWWTARRLRRGRRYVDTLPWVGRGRLLDFGMGNGRFLRLQRQRGWTVTGMDFNPEVVAHARRHDGLEAEAGSWPGPAFADRQFDIITSWHVIEHLPDPVGYLRAAAERLAPGGVLLTCCPNGRSWAAAFFKQYWIGYDTPRHFSVFTKPQLIRLVEEAGLRFVRHRPQVRPATLRASCEIRAKHTGSSFWGFAARRKLFWSVVARLSGAFGRCDCMIVIAEKPAA